MNVMTAPEQPGPQRPSITAVASIVSATATVLLGVLLGVNAVHRLSTDLFCWGSLGLAGVALLPLFWVVLAGVHDLPVLLIGAVALGAYGGALADALDGVHSSRYLTAGLAACLALQVALLARSTAGVPGPREWPRWWAVGTLGAIVVGAGVRLAVDGATRSTYDAALAVALGAAPAGLGVAVLAPLALGSARAARHGVTIRNTSAVERAAGVRSLVLDGLSTLVAGKHVTEVAPLDESHLRNLRWFAGALAHAGDDPVSQAIARLSVRGNLTGVSHSPATGLSGSVDRHPVRLTTPEAIGLGAADATVVPGQTVGVEVDRRPLGTIRVEDSVRPGAAEAVAGLREAGIDPVLISAATGPTASVVMGETGVSHLVERHSAPPSHDLARALELCKHPAARTAAVVGAGVSEPGELFHLGPDSDGIALEEASVESAALALRMGRAIWTVTRKAAGVAIGGQALVTIVALAGLLPAWAAAIGSAALCCVTWTMVVVALPSGEAPATA